MAIAIAVAVTVIVAVAANPTQVKFQTLYQLSTKKSLKLPIRLELIRNPSFRNFRRELLNSMAILGHQQAAM